MTKNQRVQEILVEINAGNKRNCHPAYKLQLALDRYIKEKRYDEILEWL